MNTDTQVDLYPCPFCGKSQNQGFVHDENCFFTLSEKLKAAHGQDATLAEKVANAWKRRVVPQGYKLVPVEIHQDYAADWGHKHGRKTVGSAALAPQDAVAFYADFVEDVESPWGHQAS